MCCRWSVNVWISIAGCVDLIELAQVFDDVEISASGFHKAVLQEPPVRLALGVPLTQHVFQGRLEVTDPSKNRELSEKESMRLF